MHPTTWFITGASTGFGKAFAAYAIAKGYNVVATARDINKLSALAALAPDRVLTAAVDVNQPSTMGPAVAQAVDRFGGIDVLINNAGYGIVGALEETPDHELRAIMETNFFGAMTMTRAVLPHMRARKAGAIVNISSLGGQVSFSGFSAYSATKFALEGASEALAPEVAPFGIKVLIVEPGAFRTEFAGAAMRSMPELEAYSGSVGATRVFAKGMHATQDGDPMKAARAIDEALRSDKTPLRLQLGHDAVDAVRAHASTLLAEMAIWEPLARSTSLAAPEGSAKHSTPMP